MRKILLLTFLSVLIIPNIAFASWWNPFSWFNKPVSTINTEAKTEALENRIKELESKLNSSTIPKTENIYKPVEKQVIPSTSPKSTKPATKEPTPVKVIEQVRIEPQIDTQKICLALASDNTVNERARGVYLKFLGLTSTISKADEASSSGIESFKQRYANFLNIHDDVYKRIRELQNENKQLNFQYLNNENLLEIKDNNSNAISYLKVYYDNHLKTLDFIVNSYPAWDEYMAAQMKEMLWEDLDVLNTSKEYMMKTYQPPYPYGKNTQQYESLIAINKCRP